jgi:hypothetical protein
MSKAQSICLDVIGFGRCNRFAATARQSVIGHSAFRADFYRAQLSDAEEGHNEAQQTMARTARAYLNSRCNALGRLSGAGALAQAVR